MRILLVIDYYQPQLGYSDTHIVNELSKLGHEVRVLTSNYYFPFPDYKVTVGRILGNRMKKSGIYKEMGTIVYRNKMLFEIFCRSYFKGHKNVVDEFKPDVVIANKVAGINTWIIAGLKRKYNFKLVIYDSHLPSELLRDKDKIVIKKLFYFLFRILFSSRINQEVDKFVAVQEETVGILNKYCGIKKQIDFIPLGTDVDKFCFDSKARNEIRKIHSIKKEDFVIIYTGKIIAAKGVDILFSAFNLVVQKNRNSRLLLVGDGSGDYKKMCLSKINKNFHSRLIWAGFQSNNILYKYYSSADIAVWPLQESTSMNDAASCGLPFIANNQIGTRLRVSNNNALLYRKYDVLDLSKKILLLAKNKKLRKSMGMRGRELAEKELSWKEIVKKYLIIDYKNDYRKIDFKKLSRLFLVTFVELFKIKNRQLHNRDHIKNALDWLKNAQDVNSDGGVSKWYSALYGWQPSYVETTGYIIETFLDCADYFGDYNLAKRAETMANFLLKMQLPSGGFRTHSIEESIYSYPTIFDTAQDLIGLIALYERSKKRKFYDALIKASDFLCDFQEVQGSWVKYNFGNTSHTYDTRVAYALLRSWQVTENKKYKLSAQKFFKWVIKRELENNWFSGMEFPPPHDPRPYLHNIAYTIEGFLYSGKILKNKLLIKKAVNMADKILNYYNKHDFLPGSFNEKWYSNDRYSCLTGDAQISIIWLELYELTGKHKYLLASTRMNNYLKSVHIQPFGDNNMIGGLKGSYPLFGDLLHATGYCRLAFINWGTKFFIDALLKELKLKEVYEN